MLVLVTNQFCYFTHNHHRLSEIPAHDWSQEVNGHAYKSLLLIGQKLPSAGFSLKIGKKYGTHPAPSY